MFVLCTSGVLLALTETGSQCLALILFAQNPWSATSGKFSFQHLPLACTQLMLTSAARCLGARALRGLSLSIPTLGLCLYGHRFGVTTYTFAFTLQILRLACGSFSHGGCLSAGLEALVLQQVMQKAARSSLHRANSTGW